MPSVASAGDVIKVSIQSNTPLYDTSDVVLELVSEGYERTLAMEIGFSGLEAEFVVPDILPLGEYSLVLRQGAWILDSLPFEIAEAEYANQATAFKQGLNLRVNALRAINTQDYDVAADLTRQVEELYTSAGAIHIAAKAWKELGSALFSEQQIHKAEDAFSRAYALYGSVNDAVGQAGTLLLLGEASALVSGTKETLEYLNRARTLADSCRADSIALRSRAALWRLSSGSSDTLRRQYVRDLIATSCSVRSITIRNEALTLYRELVSGNLLNNLWSFDQSYISTHSLKFECLVSSRFIASRRLLTLGNWTEGWSAPWEGLLALFTSTLLTQIIVSLSRFARLMNLTDFEFKVSTRRDMETESFLLSIDQWSEREILRETVNKYVSSDPDFQYYEELAHTIGGSLVGRTNQPNFIEMEMPLTISPQQTVERHW